MGCLHRFCKECIDKSMRLGNKECPACRMHCASRRSLRDDLLFDKLISSLFPDLDLYEKEELVLYNEEKAVNEQLQASMNECYQRQAEASRPRKGKVAAARVDQECSRQSGSKLEFGGPSNGDTSGLIYKDNHNQPTVSAIPTPCIVADQEGAEGASSPAKTNLPGWGGAGFRSQARRAATGKGTQSSRVDRLAEHLANVEKSDHKGLFWISWSYERFIWGYKLNRSLTLTPLFSFPSHLSTIKTVAVAVPDGKDDCVKIYDLGERCLSSPIWGVQAKKLKTEKSTEIGEADFGELTGEARNDGGRI
ncbi:hypothetical protein SASPL_117230 [Salvia splendens]|uniref:RING-type domain-containing protein n=1 Tax=Salvia splendens TaxID=180675 RepID=A0A8X8XZB0_SALSN|nr:hypothetical protein SASPL_117230 [Salvia splendens]